MDARSKSEKQPSLVVSLFITGTKQPNLVIFDNQTWWLVAATKINLTIENSVVVFFAMELVVTSSDSNSSETIENSVGVLFFFQWSLLLVAVVATVVKQ
jgi:hypothetical protein